MKIRTAVAATLLVSSGAVFFAAYGQQDTARPYESILPIPAAVTDLDPARVRLGDRLFHDKRLSGNGTVSCQSCHLPESGGADSRRYPIGANGKVSPINSPSIYNLRYNTRGYNWMGFTPSLERQVEVTVTNPNTMFNSWPKVLEVLAADPAMVAEFKAAYGGDNSLTQKNVIDAVVTYEKSLVTRSRFDDWLSGSDKAITATEKLGYEKFKYYGCVACHNGINVGGNLFANLGFVGDYFEGRAARGKGELIDFDKGRMLVTGKSEDLHVFRVPSLRNVALTAPYFHDGAVETLDEAILLMGRHQLGVDLPVEDRRLIAAFLGSLTGKTLEKR